MLSYLRARHACCFSYSLHERIILLMSNLERILNLQTTLLINKTDMSREYYNVFWPCFCFLFDASITFLYHNVTEKKLSIGI